MDNKAIMMLMKTMGRLSEMKNSGTNRGNMTVK